MRAFSRSGVTMGHLDRIFYDGSCGLCHRTVRFALARDHDGRLFRFTPLQSERFRHLIPADQRGRLPDSIVVLTADQRLLTRSDAVLHMLGRIGGVWGTMSTVGFAAPRPLRDAVYDSVARVRKRLFRAPEGHCPLVPKELRNRFEA
jgi:predicted DCC family thiol-disulfide oxidoreductase YuxK